MNFSSLKLSFTWAVKGVLFLFVPWFLWWALEFFNVISRSVFEAGNLVAAAIFYIAGIPLSLLFSVESLRENLTLANNNAALLISLIVVLLNFTCLKFLKLLLFSKAAESDRLDQD